MDPTLKNGFTLQITKTAQFLCGSSKILPSLPAPIEGLPTLKGHAMSHHCCLVAGQGEKASTRRRDELCYSYFRKAPALIVDHWSLLQVYSGFRIDGTTPKMSIRWGPIETTSWGVVPSILKPLYGECGCLARGENHHLTNTCGWV